MLDHSRFRTRSGAIQPRHNPTDPRLRQLRKGLLDALENVLVAQFGDKRELDIALEEMASIQSTIRKERLSPDEVTQLPFTSRSPVHIHLLISAFDDTDPDPRGHPYCWAIAQLFWTFYDIRVGESQHDTAQNVIEWVEHHCGGPAVPMGNEVLRIFGEEHPQSAGILERFTSMPGQITAFRDAISYLTVQRKKKFWAEFIDKVDVAQAAQVFERVTCTEPNDENFAPLLELCPTLPVRALDRLLILGALRRRLTGPAKHWFQRVGARKPYLAFVIHEAIDFAVETARSATPHSQEALGAMYYAFTQIIRVIMRTFPPRDPQAIVAEHPYEQFRTVARAAGLSSEHGDALLDVLQQPSVFQRLRFRDEFGRRCVVPPLSVLVVRSIPIEDARSFLEHHVVRGVVPARDFQKAVKNNLAPDWPQHVQLGLLMRLNLPPREPRMPRRVVPCSPAQPEVVIAYAPTAKVDMPVAPSAPRSRSAPSVRVPKRPARRIPSRAHSCEWCLTM